MQHRVAVATAQYYGIIGNGRQHVFDLGAGTFDVSVLELQSSGDVEVTATASPSPTPTMSAGPKPGVVPSGA